MDGKCTKAETVSSARKLQIRVNLTAAKPHLLGKKRVLLRASGPHQRSTQSSELHDALQQAIVSVKVSLPAWADPRGQGKGGVPRLLV